MSARSCTVPGATFPRGKRKHPLRIHFLCTRRATGAWRLWKQSHWVSPLSRLDLLGLQRPVTDGSNSPGLPTYESGFGRCKAREAAEIRPGLHRTDRRELGDGPEIYDCLVPCILREPCRSLRASLVPGAHLHPRGRAARPQCSSLTLGPPRKRRRRQQTPKPDGARASKGGTANRFMYKVTSSQNCVATRTILNSKQVTLQA